MTILRYKIGEDEYPVVKTKVVQDTKEERSHDNYLAKNVSLVKGVHYNSANESEQFTKYFINGLPVSKQLFHRYVKRFLCKKQPSSVPSPNPGGQLVENRLNSSDS